MSNKIKLANALVDKLHQMRKNHIHNIKLYEKEFQDTIEEVYNGKFWWEVTDCDIFMHLFECNDPEKTAIDIVKQLKII